MDYEKKYKESFERAKEKYTTCYSPALLEYIFPELKENKDIEIKKDIISNLKRYVNCIKDGYDASSAKDFVVKEIEKQIAWLEKQGEQKAVDSSQICKMEMLMTLDEAIEHCKKKSCDDTACGKEHKQLAEWLTELKVYRGSVAQEAQKAVDKVEPKFKVKYAGGEYNVFEIKDIAGVTYYGIEDEPNHIDYVQAENCERVGSYSIKENGCSFPTKPIMFSEQKSAESYCQKNCRGFQETGKCFADGECKAKREAESNNKVKPKFKVGDWIVNNISKDVFLIKSINDGYYTLEDIKGNIISPCLPPCESEAHLWAIQDAKDGDVLVSRSPFIYGKQCPYGGLNWCNNKFIKASNFIFTDSPVHPATKEQRDTLFAKMKEAGYTFDFEKKELKKVEQEQDSINSSEYINDIGGNGCYLKNIAQVSSWSKKDEKMFEYALHMIEWYSGKNEDKSRFVSDWLKSLEDRVQPKQEWSAEDNSVLKDIKVAVASYWDEDTENIILDWLKSLKQRIGG